MTQLGIELRKMLVILLCLLHVISNVQGLSTAGDKNENINSSRNQHSVIVLVNNETVKLENIHGTSMDNESTGSPTVNHIIDSRNENETMTAQPVGNDQGSKASETQQGDQPVGVLGGSGKLGKESIRMRLLFGTTTNTRYATSTVSLPAQCIASIAANSNNCAKRKKKKMRFNKASLESRTLNLQSGSTIRLDSSQDVPAIDLNPFGTFDKAFKDSHRDIRLLTSVTSFTTSTITIFSTNQAVTASLSVNCTPTGVPIMLCG